MLVSEAPLAAPKSAAQTGALLGGAHPVGAEGPSLPPRASVTVLVASGSGAGGTACPWEWAEHSLWLLSCSVGADMHTRTQRLFLRLNGSDSILHPPEKPPCTRPWSSQLGHEAETVLSQQPVNMRLFDVPQHLLQLN